MATLAVAGLYNLETNLRIDGFPLPYFPVCFPFNQITQVHSGVGLNVSVALRRLGHTVRYATLVGADEPGQHMREAMRRAGLDDGFVETRLSATPQSVILVAPDGNRQIHCDLKDIQDTPYPAEHRAALLEGVDAAVICNINFARPLLEEAQRRRIPIATDVHVLSDAADAYNRDFLAAADWLFLSHENLGEQPEAMIHALRQRYNPELIIVGLGASGALLSQRNQPTYHLPARPQRPVVNTVGAGDALFAAFIDQYLKTGDAPLALDRAQRYAGWKIGESGASAGLLDAEGFARLWA